MAGARVARHLNADRQSAVDDPLAAQGRVHGPGHGQRDGRRVPVVPQHAAVVPRVGEPGGAQGARDAAVADVRELLADAQAPGDPEHVVRGDGGPRVRVAGRGQPPVSRVASPLEHRVHQAPVVRPPLAAHLYATPVEYVEPHAGGHVSVQVRLHKRLLGPQNASTVRERSVTGVLR